MKVLEIRQIDFYNNENREYLLADEKPKRIDFLNMEFTCKPLDDGSCFVRYIYSFMDFMHRKYDGEKRDVEADFIIKPEEEIRRTYLLRRKTLDDIIKPPAFYVKLLSDEEAEKYLEQIQA